MKIDLYLCHSHFQISLPSDGVPLATSHNNNHSQGVMLTTYLLHKLPRGTLSSMHAPKYALLDGGYRAPSTPAGLKRGDEQDENQDYRSAEYAGFPKEDASSHLIVRQRIPVNMGDTFYSPSFCARCPSVVRFPGIVSTQIRAQRTMIKEGLPHPSCLRLSIVTCHSD